MRVTVTIISGVDKNGVVTITSTRDFSESHQNLQALSAKILKREIDTAETQARERLIELGWTPPERPA